MAILYVGIDLAKNAFALDGVDGAGKAVLLKPGVRRTELVGKVTKLPPCVIAMEAYSGHIIGRANSPSSTTPCG